MTLRASCGTRLSCRYLATELQVQPNFRRLNGRVWLYLNGALEPSMLCVFPKATYLVLFLCRLDSCGRQHKENAGKRPLAPLNTVWFYRELRTWPLRSQRLHRCSGACVMTVSFLCHRTSYIFKSCCMKGIYTFKNFFKGQLKGARGNKGSSRG